MKSGIKTLNIVGQNFSKVAISVNTARPINTAYPRPTVNSARTTSNVFNRTHTHVRRLFNKSTTNKNSNLKEQVNTVKGNVTTAGPKGVVSDNKGNKANVVKASACWVWRPKKKVLDHGNLQLELQEKGVIDSICSRYMTGNKSDLSDYEEINGGFVAFGGYPKGGRITSKGKISTGKLDFEDVYFVKELKFNLFSVSQICDKKNSVLFLDTECVVLSRDFKLLDENHILLRVPRKDNMYSVDLKNIVPSGGLTCLFVKATLDEARLWHMRLGHINFKTLNKLVRGNLVRGLPSKILKIITHVLLVRKESNINPLVRPRLVLVIKPHNKTPYEILLGRKPTLSFMRPFGYPVTILNTLDHLDALTMSMNYKPTVAGNQTNGNAGTKENIDACQDGKKIVPDQKYILLPLLTSDPLLSKSSKDSFDAGFKPSGEEDKMDSEHPKNEDSEVPNIEVPRINQEQDVNVNNTNNINTISPIVNAADIENNVADKNIVYGCIDDPNMPNLEEIVYSDNDEEVGAEADMNNLATTVLSAPQTRRMTKSVTDHVELKKLPYGKRAIGTKWVYRNKKDDRVTRIEAIRLFLSYASFMNFIVYQMDVKSAFLYGTIEEKVKQKDDGIFISQDKYVTDILKKFDFATIKIASTPMETNKALLKDEEAANVDVYLYRSMIGSLIYLTASRPDIMFVVCACAKFQVTQKTSHLHAVKRIFRYLKGHPKLGLWYPRDSSFNLEAFSDSDYAGASLDRKSTIGAEYVAAANCCGHVLRYHIRGAKAQIRFEAASKQSNDPPLSRVNILGSGKDIMKLSVRALDL
ncbi:ribonuclease H-like domain-containing protein [Tanacetum coccineum]|uniref:Ribonuclease H-like domain-containing protein n=1 Tax=Tanacetum coccineum TaxID=301880 RepID=A0ABQ5EEV7_9ASTR